MTHSTQLSRVNHVPLKLEGVGTDRSPLNRPGIPQEQEPRPLASAHWLEPEQQVSPQLPLIGQGLKLTPVYSTAVPPRRLSGAIRAWAYGIADYKARRWLLLMVADRIDVLEHRPTRLIKVAFGLSLVGAAAYLAHRAVRA